MIVAIRNSSTKPEVAADFANLVWGAQAFAKVACPWVCVAAEDAAHADGSTDLLCVIREQTPSDPTDAGAYHTELATGAKLAPIFTATLDRGNAVLRGAEGLLALLTHEIGETARDASCNLWVRLPDGRWQPREIADPVQSTCFAVQLPDGSTADVSNFVHVDSYFDPEGAAPYDFLGLLKAPLTILPGGYRMVADASGNVSFEFGAEFPEHLKAEKMTSRRALARGAKP